MKILIIDNYDSFTFNLYQYIGELLEEKGIDFSIDVKRNDLITLSQIKQKNYDRIILSPGPGDPKDIEYFGVCADILTKIKTIPILGVCLGMQGMAYYFGGKLTHAKKPMHGKTSVISHAGRGIFTGLPQDIEVMRYHSLVADVNTLPVCLEIIAITGVLPLVIPPVSAPSTLSQSARPGSLPLASPLFQNAEIMGLRHKSLPIVGVQFHPESFATEGGKQILTNFLFKKL